METPNSPNANFRVHTSLASILGDSYRSTEYAIKELVDNAWDADAEQIWITLPEPLTLDPIIVKDDGSGMTEKEIRNEYLVIASSRTTRKGEKTPLKNRTVKGRKGIGKFAGLTVANEMVLTSFARGIKTSISIVRDGLLLSTRDLEEVDIPVKTDRCDENERGTTVILKHLHQNFTFPNPDRLRQILVMEYGRQNGFRIFVNDLPLDVSDIPGTSSEFEENIEGVGPVKVKCTISDKPLKNSGIAFRIDDKIIGRPENFGIDENPEIPSKLAKYVYAEIEADGLRDDVTADWGAIIENSLGYQNIKTIIAPKIEQKLKEKHYQEVNALRARLGKKFQEKISKLPENRRKFAEQALEKVLTRYFESNEKIDTLVAVVLDAIEKDDYFEVLKKIDDCKDSEVTLFAESLSEFGLVEMSLITKQAKSRRAFLDYMSSLTTRGDVLEKDMHTALENNIWIFGSKFSLISSNETLRTVIKKYCDKEYSNNNYRKRPDLFLGSARDNRYLLVEFKRPNYTVSREDENQAQKYRDDLMQYLGKVEMQIIVIGGYVNTRIDSKYLSPDTKLTTFNSLISEARNEIDWLIRDLAML